MWEKCAEPGSELAKQIQQIWIPLFTPPAPPTYIPKDVFFAQMNEGIKKRFADVTAAVEKIRSRGGKIVFVRFPNSGGLKELEDRITPREKSLGSAFEDDRCARNLLLRFSRSLWV